MSYPLVWSERETGDWESCVASSYLMGLVYGGITNFPLGIYTQAEREAIEVTPDEPQNYAATDLKAKARYGVTLRPLSTGSIVGAVARPGIGLLCAGPGFPPGQNWGQTPPSAHSVFYLPVTTTNGLLYDPMALNKSAGKPYLAANIVAWVASAGANHAREVRPNEFSRDMTITVTKYPALRQNKVKVGTLTGYRPSPAPTTKTATWTTTSGFPSDAEATFDPLPAGWPAGPYQRVTAGAYAGYYLNNAQVTLGPLPPSFTQAQVEAAAKAAVDQNEAKWEAWNDAAQASKP